MSEYYEHNPGDHEDPLPGPTWLVSAIGVILLVVIVLGLTALYYNAEQDLVEQRVVRQPVIEMQNLQQQQLAQINDPPRRQEVLVGEDREERLIIPIDRAMQIVVNERK